jgi:ribosomal protein S18 acetylase RimI-like enzyme
VLRRARPDDLADYADLCRRTFTDAYAANHEADALARHVAVAFRDERLRDELASDDAPVFLVAHEGILVAYACLGLGPAPAGVHGTRPVEIVRFYVDRAWHGRGIAGPLMDAVLGAARDAGGDVAWLTTWEHNSRALGFYARQGFARVGRATYLFDGVPENDQLLAIPL